MDVAQGEDLKTTERLARPATPEESAQFVQLLLGVEAMRVGGVAKSIDSGYPEGAFARLYWSHMRGTDMTSGIVDFMPPESATRTAAFLSALLGQPCLMALTQ